MPSLDPTTLLIVCCAVISLAGVQFIVTWRQVPACVALALWGCAHLLGAVASVGVALRGVIPDWASIDLANAIMIAAYGLIWSGVRSFERRPPLLRWALLGAACWMLLCQFPPFYGNLGARVTCASFLAGSYCAAAAMEFWRGRSEALPSRATAIGLLIAYAACYFVRIPAVFIAPLPAGQSPLTSAWVPILCLAAMLFSVASAFSFIGLTKERAEREQHLAARTDPLTGVANRRAFVEMADALLAKRHEVFLLLFDLDRFKGVNDRFGHEVGDGVLVAFCAVAGRMLPERAIFGRLGGEEFACLLIGASTPSARFAADEVRRTFAQIVLPDIPELSLSVSIGLAQATPTCNFDRLLRRADAALYAAKQRGRNRVEVADAIPLMA